MVQTNNEELVKRIAKLAKQNQELEEYIKKLEKQNEKLSRDVEKLKALAEKQGADEATLITPPEQRSEVLPDWLAKPPARM